MYNELYLENSMKRIFTNCNQSGFWNEKEGRIIESLYHDENWVWEYRYDDKYKYRYGLFTLSMILLAKDVFYLDTKKYDDKIIRNLKWIKGKESEFSISDYTYGGLLCLILGYKHYNLFKNDEKSLIKKFNKILSIVFNDFDNQHYLILISAKYHLDLFNDGKTLTLSNQLTDKILDIQSNNGFFISGDLRAYHHQRTMYTLWGLTFFSWHHRKDDIKKAILITINWIWKNRRDKIDNGFIWHPSFYWVESKYRIKIPVYLPKSSKYLFECHQTFFANAINFYNLRYNDKKFLSEKNDALSWIFGQNRINKNLIDNTSIDIPSRIMHFDGSLQIKNEQFKGSYEIGSFILSMVA